MTPKRGDVKKFELDGKKVNFKFVGIAHSEKSKEARKEGAKRNNYYMRTLSEKGNDHSIWVRKRK